VHSVSDAKQTEMHTTQLLVPGPNHREAEAALANLEKYNHKESSNITRTHSNGGMPVIHNLFTSIWNKEEMPEE
jgi:hypothetical protein